MLIIKIIIFISIIQLFGGRDAVSDLSTQFADGGSILAASYGEEEWEK